MTEDEDRSSKADGPVGRMKGLLAKATQAVAGIVKKDDAGDGAGATGAVPDSKPSERAAKMKDAVEAARKGKDDD